MNGLPRWAHLARLMRSEWLSWQSIARQFGELYSDISARSGRQSPQSSCGLTMIEHITPLIITYNESANIARTLKRLAWARRIVVIDSGSTDETVADRAVISAGRVDSSALRQFRQPVQLWDWAGNHGLGTVARCRLRVK